MCPQRLIKTKLSNRDPLKGLAQPDSKNLGGITLYWTGLDLVQTIDQQCLQAQDTPKQKCGLTMCFKIRVRQQDVLIKLGCDGKDYAKNHKHSSDGKGCVQP